MTGCKLIVNLCQNPDDIAHTPYTDSYLTTPAPKHHMTPSSPMDSASEVWNHRVVNDLDNLMSQGSGQTSRFQDRPLFPEEFGPFDTSTQPMHLPSLKPSDPNSLNRFVKDTAGPWNPEQVCGNLGQEHMEMINGRPYVRANPNIYYPRSSPKSAIGSDTISRDRLDSGYGTKSVTNSARDQSDGCQSIAGEVRSFHVYPDNNSFEASSVYSHEHSYGPVDMGGEDTPEASSIYPMKCAHPGCKKESKNHSDYKYVLLYASCLNWLMVSSLGSISRGILGLTNALCLIVLRTLVQTMILRDTKNLSTR